jgi:cation diffusion facilitator family transporter
MTSINISTPEPDRSQAEREKQSVALSSVLAATFLTAIKIGVGLWTGSLGILAEAAHSGLDLVAALLTFLAVRVSDKPADLRHPYGHDKVENLSALAETILLLVTCVWIFYEAIDRLFFNPVAVEANVWAFAVMIISIVVDFSRSRALKRTAEKYGSQALEADALHFSTDIWSSSAVIGGLLLVRIGEWLGGSPILGKADAIAALAVAFIVVYVSLEMGWKTVSVLLDTAPEGLASEIKGHVCQIKGVVGCRRVRVRRAGAKSFVDIILEIEKDASFHTAHEITSQVEELVRQLIPRADVLIHYEPGESPAPTSQVQTSAATTPEGLANEIKTHICQVAGVVGCRRVRVRPAGAKSFVDIVLEIEKDVSFQAAHEVTSQAEELVRQLVPNADVLVHYEPGEVSFD